MLGDVPAVPKRIRQLPMALTPELIGELVADLRAGLKCPLPQRARIAGLDLQHRCGAADACRGENPGLRELTGHVQLAVADLQHDREYFAAGQRHPRLLTRAERALIP